MDTRKPENQLENSVVCTKCWNIFAATASRNNAIAQCPNCGESIEIPSTPIKAAEMSPPKNSPKKSKPDSSAITGSIKFNCPACKKEIQSVAEDAGMLGKCPNCNTTVTVPPIESGANWGPAPLTPVQLLQDLPLQGSPPNIKPGAPALGKLICGVGIFFLLWGGNTWFSANETENMYKGTVLEKNRDTQTIFQNARSGGMFWVAVGVGLLVLGGVVTNGTRKS